MIDKLHVFISLIAGILFTIVTLLNKLGFGFWLPNVIVVITIFYIAGLIFRFYIKKSIEKNKVDISVSSEFVSDDNEKNPIETFDD